MEMTWMGNDANVAACRRSGRPADLGLAGPVTGAAGGVMNDEGLADRLQSRYGIPRYEAVELIALFGEYL